VELVKIFRFYRLNRALFKKKRGVLVQNTQRTVPAATTDLILNAIQRLIRKQKQRLRNESQTLSHSSESSVIEVAKLGANQITSSLD